MHRWEFPDQSHRMFKTVPLPTHPIPSAPRRAFPQARPQAKQNPQRTLWGTLRVLMSRERSWRPFSTSC